MGGVHCLQRGTRGIARNAWLASAVLSVWGGSLQRKLREPALQAIAENGSAATGTLAVVVAAAVQREMVAVAATAAKLAAAAVKAAMDSPRPEVAPA